MNVWTIQCRYSECSNSTKTGGYTEFEMKRGNPLNSSTADADEPERVPIIDLVSANQVMAVYTDDDEHDYYLLKTAKGASTLETETTDSWGCSLPAGTVILTGLYYDRCKKSPLSFKVVRGKKAIVPVASPKLTLFI